MNKTITYDMPSEGKDKISYLVSGYSEAVRNHYIEKAVSQSETLFIINFDKSVSSKTFSIFKNAKYVNFEKQTSIMNAGTGFDVIYVIRSVMRNIMNMPSDVIAGVVHYMTLIKEIYQINYPEQVLTAEELKKYNNVDFVEAEIESACRKNGTDEYSMKQRYLESASDAVTLSNILIHIESLIGTNAFDNSMYLKGEMNFFDFSEIESEDKLLVNLDNIKLALIDMTRKVEAGVIIINSSNRHLSVISDMLDKLPHKATFSYFTKDIFSNCDDNICYDFLEEFDVNVFSAHNYISGQKISAMFPERIVCTSGYAERRMLHNPYTNIFRKKAERNSASNLEYRPMYDANTIMNMTQNRALVYERKSNRHRIEGI